MQQTRNIIRQIGIPNPELNIISEDEFQQYLEYQYYSQGWEFVTSHFLGEIKSHVGEVIGYKIMYVLKNGFSELPRAMREKKQ